MKRFSGKFSLIVLVAALVGLCAVGYHKIGDKQAALLPSVERELKNGEEALVNGRPDIAAYALTRLKEELFPQLGKVYSPPRVQRAFAAYKGRFSVLKERLAVLCLDRAEKIQCISSLLRAGELPDAKRQLAAWLSCTTLDSLAYDAAFRQGGVIGRLTFYVMEMDTGHYTRAAAYAPDLAFNCSVTPMLARLYNQSSTPVSLDSLTAAMNAVGAAADTLRIMAERAEKDALPRTLQRMIAGTERVSRQDLQDEESFNPLVRGRALVWDRQRNAVDPAMSLVAEDLQAHSDTRVVTIFWVERDTLGVGTYSTTQVPACRQVATIAVTYWPASIGGGATRILGPEPPSEIYVNQQTGEVVSDGLPRSAIRPRTLDVSRGLGPGARVQYSVDWTVARWISGLARDPRFEVPSMYHGQSFRDRVPEE